MASQKLGVLFVGDEEKPQILDLAAGELCPWGRKVGDWREAAELGTNPRTPECSK